MAEIQNTVEEKRKTFSRWASVIALAVTAFLISPYIASVIGGSIGIGVALVAGIAIVSLTPWVTLKIANIKYRAIDAEKVAHVKLVTEAAAENPIETMITVLSSNNVAFDNFRKVVTTAVQARDTFRGKIEEFAKAYPARAIEFQTQLDRMNIQVEKKKSALVAAQTSLADGEKKLAEMKAYWDMSLALQEANKAAGMETGDQFELLKVNTACDTVFKSMNQAFAQLEVAAMLDIAAPVGSIPVPVQQLAYQTTDTLGTQILGPVLAEKVRR